MDSRLKEGLSQAWRLLEEFYIIAPGDTGRWDQLVQRAADLSRQYAAYPLVTSFIFSVMEDIDRRSR